MLLGIWHLNNCQQTCVSLQVRSQELEVQFAATTAELQDLKSKQKTLEARNLLLEKLVQLSKQQQQPTSEVAANTDVSC